MGTVPALGIVNSLQLLSAPKGFLKSTSWVGAADPSSVATTGGVNGNSSTVKITGIEALLLVAGLGQEHRLGRWLTIKGEGAVNSTVVQAFLPKVAHD